MPRMKNIRGTWLHRRLGERLFLPELWHPTRQRFAAGLAVGAFFAMILVPFQMLAAGICAYFMRVNIPAAIAATWISNPLTSPFCIYAQYRLGCFLLGQGPMILPSHNPFAMLKELWEHAPVPFLVGTIPSAVILALIVYPLTLLIWDVLTARINARRKLREPGGL